MKLRDGRKMWWSLKTKAESAEKYRINSSSRRASGKCYRFKTKDWKVSIGLEPESSKTWRIDMQFRKESSVILTGLRKRRRTWKTSTRHKWSVSWNWNSTSKNHNNSWRLFGNCKCDTSHPNPNFNPSKNKTNGWPPKFYSTHLSFRFYPN